MAILDSELQVTIRSRRQRSRYKKCGIFCEIGDNILVSVDILIHNGALNLVNCKCDNCDILFRRTAREIRVRKFGGNFCSSCGKLFGPKGKKRTDEWKWAHSIILTEFYKTEKGIRSKTTRGEKLKGVKLGVKRPGIGGSLPGSLNPSWKDKSGFDLFRYECYVVKRRTIKALNLSCNKGEGIYYKISLKKAYQIGMLPAFVGTQLIILDMNDARSIHSLGNTNGKNQKKKRRISKFSSYQTKVGRLTNKIYEECEDIINPNKYTRGQQRKGNNNYHIDHIIPITICWDNGITPEVASSIENLRMLPWKENISKGGRLLKEHENLLHQLIEKSKIGDSHE